jgi:hypothetical protein
MVSQMNFSGSPKRDDLPFERSVQIKDNMER